MKVTTMPMKNSEALFINHFIWEWLTQFIKLTEVELLQITSKQLLVPNLKAQEISTEKTKVIATIFLFLSQLNLVLKISTLELRDKSRLKLR